MERMLPVDLLTFTVWAVAVLLGVVALLAWQTVRRHMGWARRRRQFDLDRWGALMEEKRRQEARNVAWGEPAPRDF